MPTEPPLNELALVREASPYLMRALRQCVDMLWLRAMANEIDPEEVQALRSGTIALQAALSGSHGLIELLEDIP